MNNAEYMAEEIGKALVGGTVSRAILSEDKESFGFAITSKAGRFTVWVDCDPEGNGPGWLSIERV